MWDLFQKIIKANLTPNESLILFSMKQKVSLPLLDQKDKVSLVNKGFLELKDKKYIMTSQSKAICARLDSYFIKIKKKTDIQLMGKDFLETYDHSWDQIHEATRMHVNEYRDAEYMYMQTSQYFICKQDKHRVKHSTLADYCDMIVDGVSTEDEHFKENVV